MKSIQKFENTFLLFLIMIALSSCLSNVDEIEEIDSCAAITFSMHVKPIIDNNCISCHSLEGGQSPNLETYNAVSANALRVKSEVVLREMPIGGSLTNEEITAISCWVDAGALNN